MLLIPLILFISVTLPLNVLSSSIPDFYSYSAKDANGNMVSFHKYEKKVVLVTNVASYCGYTAIHYVDFVELKKKYGDWLHILAFPCNQFGEQEPEDVGTIIQKMKRQYKVNFEIFDKIEVTGPNVPDFWKYLTAHQESPQWNFHKYLINTYGQVVGSWGPQTGVDLISDVIQKTIREAQLRDEL